MAQELEGLIAHEIVHQWFGNSATEKIGAIYGSVRLCYLSYQCLFWKTKGVSAFRDRLKKNEKRLLPLRNATKVLSLIQPTIAWTYWTRIAIKRVVGSCICLETSLEMKTFIKPFTYYQKYRLSNADTKDFQKVAEQVSGKDLMVFWPMALSSRTSKIKYWIGSSRK